MLQVKSIVLGIVGTNCYIVYDKNTKEAVLIDPGAEEDRIIAFLEEEDLKPRAILLTHGHFDHILAVPTLREKYCLYMHRRRRESFSETESSTYRVRIRRTAWRFRILFLCMMEKSCPYWERAGRSFLLRDIPGDRSATLWMEISLTFLAGIRFFVNPTEGQIYTAEVKRRLLKI